MKKRLRLGMVGGGQGAFIGAVHRLSARMDDKYEFVAGCLSSTPEKSILSAKEIGLDWLEVSGVIHKLKEETDEVIEAIDLEDKMAMREEIGDLLFTVLCLSRHLDISPDEILDSANKKFNARCLYWSGCYCWVSW